MSKSLKFFWLLWYSGRFDKEPENRRMVLIHQVAIQVPLVPQRNKMVYNNMKTFRQFTAHARMEEIKGEREIKRKRE